MSNHTYSPKTMNSKVPWEPYKAATNLNKTPQESNEFNFLKENLVRYKVSTDLALFNAQRPGSQFDENDFQRINESFTQNDELNFIDARFYTDFHFLKLADELKSKCLESKSQTKKSPSPLNKPIQVRFFRSI